MTVKNSGNKCRIQIAGVKMFQEYLKSLQTFRNLKKLNFVDKYNTYYQIIYYFYD